MLNRLTYSSYDIVAPTKLNTAFIFGMSDENYTALTDIFNKLCEYEDTGLTPVEIVKLQLQVKKHNNLAAKYGIDGETMLALAESKIKTSADNVELREQLSESERQRLAAVECINSTETYLELGSGKHAYNTIKKWRETQKGENK